MDGIMGVIWMMFGVLAFGAALVVGGLFVYNRWLKSGQERGY